MGDSISKSIMAHTYPIERNKIFVRFANLGDRFDESSASQMTYVDVEKWAVEFYNQANPHLPPASIGSLKMTIEETTMSTNQLQKTMEKKKFRFRGVDDELAKHHKRAAPAAEGPHSHALEHQNIRTFTISYMSVNQGNK
jgi:hypothetical protein